MSATDNQTFNPDTDIPDLSNKVFFITGGNTGLGKAAITALAAHRPGQIFLSGRSEQKCLEAISDIKNALPTANIIFIQLDLSSHSSVKSAASAFLRQSQRLDVLMNNAGIMAVPAGLTADGYEIQLGTNHLGHALLTKLLLPTLQKTAAEHGDARIITLASMGSHAVPPRGINFDTLKTTQEDIGSGATWLRYGQSKIANILYAKQLATHYPQILSVAVHPGIVDTQLVHNIAWYNRYFVYFMVVARWLFPMMSEWVTPDIGARNQVWAATTRREEVENGGFYEPVGVKGRHTELTSSEELGRQLWEWTEKELEGWEL